MLNVEKNFEDLTISYIDSNRDISLMKIPISKNQLWNWQVTDENDAHKDPHFKSWNNLPIKKVPCRSAKDFTKFRVEEIIQELYEGQRKKLFQYVHPKKYFIDIEIEIQDEFPNATEAKYPISTIAICNEQNLIVVLGTKKITAEEHDFIVNKIREQIGHLKKEFSFRYEYFETEGSMMATFVHRLLPKFAFITGWNFVKFDWTYIFNRCKKLNIDLSVASPSKKFFRGNMLMHKLIVDYLDIYIKWDRVVEMKEHNNLDWVAKKVLGVNKIKYAGTLKDLFDKDFPLYVAYNAVDALLVRLLDEKLNTLSTFLKLSSISEVETMKAFSPVWVSDALCFREFYKKKRIIIAQEFDESTNSSDDDESDYEGAYVKTPVPGLYDWITCFDFASLYPSLMRQFNMSPDAYVGRGFSTPPEEGQVDSSIGTRFDNTFNSIIRIILDDYYGKRVQTKSIAKKAEILIDKINSLKKEKTY